jgi:hypothetical protein
MPDESNSYEVESENKVNLPAQALKSMHCDI